ncbi:MAG: aminopeptidase P family protein [Lachnospiraceae bacterium]|jgi:Xaa-Pro aminopeptidase|nr:aminopeptidase P family protein [Lachnospiraceae bacterium]
MIAERIEALRTEMRKRGIAIYLIPTSDFHESEYVGDYFKARQYLTGFTGSAGTAVITMKEAGLWTDGRYFIQAKRELAGSPVTLYCMGEEGVPTVKEYVERSFEIGDCLGFDGRVVNAKAAEEYEKIAEKKKGRIASDEDLMGLIWKERPKLPRNAAFILEEKYAGTGTQDKLKALREQMSKKQADIHILTSLYDIAWLFNIRGRDIPHVPVVLSFAVITMEESIWFVQQEALDDKVLSYCQENHIAIRPYEAVYSYAAEILAGKRVLLDPAIVNDRICRSLGKEVHVIHEKNPTESSKAIKNKTELSNIRNAHVKDGVAFTKFMYWLKTHIGTEELTELSAAKYLEQLRSEQELFLDLSFDTISAYGPNAAMMHYTAVPEANATLYPEGFLLVDSGGHYLDGSTDITRTIALGRLSREAKLHFTTVCRANLNLSAAKFLHGCRGSNLDILARGPLWNLGLDYKCGTGHGIGYLLNVHEGPNSFRWRTTQEHGDGCVLEEGMVTTDEPGIYLEGKYGIRTENELLCKKAEKNEYGQFLEFEIITYAPIDLDAILPEEMTAAERGLLNNYHKMVYEKISPYLEPEERAWLKEYTRAVY